MTAKSQLMGGMIWGISAALFEKAEIDRKLARYYNDDLTEYLLPVNADIKDVEVISVPEQDREVNPLGIKGVGELGMTGMNAAVANAVFHATGVHVQAADPYREPVAGLTRSGYAQNTYARPVEIGGTSPPVHNEMQYLAPESRGPTQPALIICKKASGSNKNRKSAHGE